MAAGAQVGAPPMSPDVRRQQMGPAMAVYRQAATGGQQVPQQDAGKDFVKQGFGQIAETMTRMAKVIQVEQPELMPLLVRAAGALKVLEQEFIKTSQGQGKQVQPPEPTANGSEGAANIGA